jgi:hypothetical protein
MATIRRYSQKTLPAWVKEQILNRRRWNALCRRFVLHTYAKEALDSASLIWVAFEDDEVKGFLLALDDSFNTVLDGKPRPVCRPDEWYVDVVCSVPGTGIMSRFYSDAKKANKRAIRLYSVERAIPYWKRAGFRECDDCNSIRCYRKTYKKDDTQFRMLKCLS